MSSSACNALKFFSVESLRVKLQFTIDIFFQNSRFAEIIRHQILIQTLKFLTRLPDGQDGVENRVTRSICLPNTKPTKRSLQTNRKQGFKKDFPQYFNDTTPPKTFYEVRKVLLFQDILIFWLSVNNFGFCYLAFVSCAFLECGYAA